MEFHTDTFLFCCLMVLLWVGLIHGDEWIAKIRDASKKRKDQHNA